MESSKKQDEATKRDEAQFQVETESSKESLNDKDLDKINGGLISVANVVVTAVTGGAGATSPQPGDVSFLKYLEVER